MTGQEITLFYSYAHEDEHLRNELAKHLRIMERQRALKGWHDREISAGSDWRGQIDQNLQSADIVLLLVSPDFVASDYCYDVELACALRRHNVGECVVIPVFLRSVDIADAPFSALQGLPKDARPVTAWPDRDAAFTDIAVGIKKVALRLGGSRGVPTLRSRNCNSDSPMFKDIAGIREYRSLFDRPAFSTPRVFEHALEDINDTCGQITSAMLTGEVKHKDGYVIYTVPKRAEFETEPFMSTLTQARNYVSNLKRTVNYLRLHLSRPDWPQPRNTHQNPGNIFHMEFYLAELISFGVSREYVIEAFAIMDKIDSERNAILQIMNSLFAISNLRELPPITLSSKQLELSEHMEPYSWDKNYLRTHVELRRFLQTA